MVLPGLRCLLQGSVDGYCNILGSSRMLYQAAALCCRGFGPLTALHQHQARSIHAAAATAVAAAAADTTPEPSGSTQGQQQEQRAAAAAGGDDRNVSKQQQQDATPPDPALQLLMEQYQRSRMQQFYSNHLARELMLKLRVNTIEQLPLLRSIDLAVVAKDLHGERYVEKWQMLLPALALEYITGQPASFVHSKLKYYRSRNAVTAVKVCVKGAEAFDLLQKLVYVVLPSQNGFNGISSKSFDAAGNLHFRVQRMVNFPDFEEQFEVFENLGGLHVSINLGNVVPAKHPQRAKLLLTGLQLPIHTKGGDAAEGAAAASAGGQEGVAAAAAEELDGGSSRDEE